MAQTYTETPIIIRDLFEGLVNEVGVNINNDISAKYTAAQDSSEPILLRTQYMHGTVKELVSQLNEKNDSPEDKEFMFPIIALIHNFREGFGKEDCYNETEFTFWILHLGNAQDHFPIRYKKTLEPVIYPLWQEFVQVIKDSYKFKYDEVGGLDHEKIDRPKWGRFGDSNDAYELNEHIDGIELKINLKLYPENCLQNKLGSEGVAFYK